MGFEVERQKSKGKGVREPSEEENSRGLGVRREAPVSYGMAEAMTRKATAKAMATAKAKRGASLCSG
jgi:hypothetical protein